MRKLERTSHPWRAVSVAPGDAPCAPVRAMVGKRFLVAQAPALPLLECPWSDDCDCQFRHHDDRRAEERAEKRAASALERHRRNADPTPVK